MIGELPKLFDRNFAVGYFLPLAIFITVSSGLFGNSKLPITIPSSMSNSQLELILGTTTIVLLSWIGGVLLLAINRDLIRLLEGYGRFNPAHLFHFIEKRRYKKIKQEISKIIEEHNNLKLENKELPQERRTRYNTLLREVGEKFPDEERWLLPTSFGNIIRSFEVYPRVMYGLDAIPGWSRLLGVIPKDYREIVDNAKAQVDLWCNLWLLGILFFAEYAGVMIYKNQLESLWIPILTTGIIIVAYLRARNAAIEWGDSIKSAFDLFLPDLCNKLNFSLPATPEEQRSMWRSFSQATIYTKPECLPKRNVKPENNRQ